MMVPLVVVIREPIITVVVVKPVAGCTVVVSAAGWFAVDDV